MAVFGATSSIGPNVGGQAQQLSPTQTQFTSPSTPTPTTNIVAGFQAVGAITGAFMAYQAGQAQKVAFEHEAAMAEINARQIGIDAQFIMADKETELANTLALQNVINAASGRSGGSVSAIAETSVSNVRRDEERIRLTGQARKVATLMDASSSRAAGSSAARFGLLSSVAELGKGAAQVSRFIT